MPLGGARRCPARAAFLFATRAGTTLSTATCSFAMPDADGFFAPSPFIVPETAGNMRLDAVLGLLFPQFGLRARRRLWDRHHICVNGKSRKPGFLARPGDTVTVIRREALPRQGRDGSGDPLLSDPAGISGRLLRQTRLLTLSRDFAAFCKPAGAHSAHISGGGADNIERMLAAHWPRMWSEWAQARGNDEGSTPHRPRPGPETCFPVPLLLTRLDKETSGILLAARHEEAATRFRLLEKQGLVKKTYYALVEGALEQALLLARRLDTDNRSRSLVLEENDPDPARHSRVAPVRLLRAEEKEALFRAGYEQRVTLVKVEIRRGARHQIRAHLAGAGFALPGDRVYAPADTGTALPALFLHHARIDLPDFSARCLPDWPFFSAEDAGEATAAPPQAG